MTEERPPSPELSEIRIVEQYKSYVADLGNIGSRYATSNGFYLSVVSALLALFTLKNLANLNKEEIVVRGIALLFACVLCFVWSKTIRFYRAIFRAKFEVIRELEKNLPYPCYSKEYELLSQADAGWLTRNEVRVPLVLALFFIANFLYMIWVFVF